LTTTNQRSVTVTKRIQRAVLIVAGLAALALGGASLANAGSSGTSSSAAPAAKVAPAAKATPPSASQDPAGPNDTADKPGQETAAEGPDTDNVQDTTTPDTGSSKASPAGSEAPGSEVPNNDGPGGHADEPGNPNANHDFQGVE
jgi:hypothetical protein